jgi:hypothetical protein
MQGATTYCILQCKTRYGFASDPSLPLWQNKQIATTTTPPSHTSTKNQPSSGPKNRAFHQLHDGSLPNGTKALLGLGLKFFLEAPTPIRDIRDYLDRLRQSCRLRMWLDEEAPEDNQDYIPGLYLQSPWRAPHGDHNLESRLLAFEIDLNAAIESRPLIAKTTSPTTKDAPSPN